MNLHIEYVNLGDIAPNPWNPHGTTDEEMDDLIESIATKGVVDTPLVVRWDRPVVYEGQEIQPDKPFMLIDGEQRFTATRAAFMRGLIDRPEIPVTVLGNLSDYEEAYLAELGEALNHRGRGSKEDLEKTGIIAKMLMKNRSVEEAARLMGKRTDFIAKALATANKRPLPAPTPTPERVAAQRVQHEKERKALNVVLPFEDELDVEEFESLLSNVVVGSDYRTKGHRRTAQVMEALRAYAFGVDEE